MKILARHLFKIFLSSIRDIMPILIVVLFFQLVVLGNPINHLEDLFLGIALVIVGLALFVFGLELGLFPIGDSMAVSLVDKGSISWLIIFAFCLGFGTTFAEPALIAVAKESADAAATGGMIGATEKESFAAGLRTVVASAAGTAIILGVLRILYGWSIRNILMIAYILIVIITIFAPVEIIGIAYDIGGVTTSTITVPLIAALGIGLARSIKGRNPMLDGFGIIAFAALMPIIFVLIYGIII